MMRMSGSLCEAMLEMIEKMIKSLTGGKEWTSARARQKGENCAVGGPSRSSRPFVFVQAAYYHNEGSNINCWNVSIYLPTYNTERIAQQQID